MSDDSIAANGRVDRSVRAQEELEDLLGVYFDAGVLEGRERRDHDTPDGLAQKAFNAVRDCVKRMVEEEREACARLAATEAVLQHEADTARNPRAAVMHSPDAAKWLKMAAMIRMRSNVRGKARP